jgi:hypothetical protein
MDDINRWIAHSRMSNPGRHAGLFSRLPADVVTLNEIIQGVLIHLNWVKEYGLDETRYNASARATLPIVERLSDILERDLSTLDIRRPAEKRSPGTCRDFALMLCSLLRCKGTPARVRCGFAAYFSDNWEDHWVCEYWDSATRKWLICDAQIDYILRRKLSIEFNPADVPRRCFVSAGEAWMKCRATNTDPRAFGHDSVTGIWFLKVNVFRDHYVLNNREVSPWDRWREANNSNRVVVDDELEFLDDLAAHPEQPFVGVHRIG